MNKVAIYPGTFDPITYGHIDVIKKSLKLFDKIVVGVSDVSNKNYLFNSDERIDIVNKLYEQGNTIFFMTARGMGRSFNNSTEAYKQLYNFTKNQLDQWGVKYHDLFMGKPKADYYIDDKAIRAERFFIHQF